MNNEIFGSFSYPVPSEMQSRIDAMGPNEMEGVLLSLEGTQSWVAILKYLQMRFAYAQTNLLTQDPVTNATAIARTQGILSGLADLPTMVKNIRERRDREAEKAEREKE